MKFRLYNVRYEHGLQTRQRPKRRESLCDVKKDGQKNRYNSYMNDIQFNDIQFDVLFYVGVSSILIYLWNMTQYHM